MRTRLPFQIILPVFGIFLCCAASVSAQIRTGGYKEIAKDDEGAVAAAGFAVNAQGEKQGNAIALVEVEHAETQVVAGINYRLCLKIQVDDADPKEVRVVVYKNLQREFSLKSWEDAKCGESDAEKDPGSSGRSLVEIMKRFNAEQTQAE
jgi:hypothetical protein